MHHQYQFSSQIFPADLLAPRIRVVLSCILQQLVGQEAAWCLCLKEGIEYFSLKIVSPGLPNPFAVAAEKKTAWLHRLWLQGESVNYNAPMFLPPLAFLATKSNADWDFSYIPQVFLNITLSYGISLRHKQELTGKKNNNRKKNGVRQ